MAEMKGIKLCGECANYNWKNHKCRIGCNDDSDAQSCFYGDCPLPDVVPKSEWISVDERLPKEYESVLGYMKDAGVFPPVRECYLVGRVFFFPALKDMHPVSHWMPMPAPPITDKPAQE